jgi:hypothetical protein
VEHKEHTMASDWKQDLTAFIEHEVREKEFPSLSIALVVDQETIWSRKFSLSTEVTNELR